MVVKPQTLMVAIQCVAIRTQQLAKVLDGEDRKGAEIEQLLVAYDLAAEELRGAYEEALVQFAGLPPYIELIKGQH